MNLKLFTIVGFFILLITLNPGYAITYSNENPDGNSTIYTDVINYTIDFIEVSVSDANYGLISINRGSGYTNYTASVVNTTATYYIDGQLGTAISYIWYIGNSTDWETPSEEYSFEKARLTGVFMTIRALPQMIDGILNLVIYIGIIILILGVVGFVKGWFKGLNLKLRFK